MALDQPTARALVYWAGCSYHHSLLERAKGAAAAGFTEVTCFSRDLVAIEEQGHSLSSVRKELIDIGIRLNAIDPFYDWYPSFDPKAPVGIAVKFGGANLKVTEDQLLRWVDALEVPYVNLVAPFDDPTGEFEDPPVSATEEIVESLGRLGERAAEVGLRAHIEVIPTTKVPDLSRAHEIVAAVDHPNVGLLLDTYHLGRAETTTDQIDAVPREEIFQIQLCDTDLADCTENYLEDAFLGRSFAGDGELGVGEMIDRIAAKGPLPPSGPEVFNTPRNGLPPAAAARESLTATRRFLASAAATA